MKEEERGGPPGPQGAPTLSLLPSIIINFLSFSLIFIHFGDLKILENPCWKIVRKSFENFGVICDGSGSNLVPVQELVFLKSGTLKEPEPVWNRNRSEPEPAEPEPEPEPAEPEPSAQEPNRTEPNRELPVNCYCETIAPEALMPSLELVFLKI